MKAFIALLAMSLVASVQGQEVCADAIAKIPDCAVSSQITCLGHQRKDANLVSSEAAFETLQAPSDVPKGI